MNKKNNIKTVNEFKELLIKILESGGHIRESLVKEFEDKLNSYYEGGFLDEDVNTLLNDLLIDMAYYQPNPIIRLTDKKHLLDDKQLNKRIKEVLDKLNSGIFQPGSGDTHHNYCGQ